MKAKAKDEFVPRALREVWEWKDSIYQEVKHLQTDQALHEIMRMAHEVAVEEGFVPASPPAAKVAETPAKYTAKRKKRVAGSS
jgi:hypothetical protein